MSDERFFAQVKSTLENYAPAVNQEAYAGMRRKLWWSNFTKLSATRMNMWYLILLLAAGAGATAYYFNGSASANRPTAGGAPSFQVTVPNATQASNTAAIGSCTSNTNVAACCASNGSSKSSACSTSNGMNASVTPLVNPATSHPADNATAWALTDPKDLSDVNNQQPIITDQSVTTDTQLENQKTKLRGQKPLKIGVLKDKDPQETSKVKE
jgi:hypothetical protein